MVRYESEVYIMTTRAGPTKFACTNIAIIAANRGARSHPTCRVYPQARERESNAVAEA